MKLCLYVLSIFLLCADPAHAVLLCGIDSKKSDLCVANIDQLKPTQPAVGWLEVHKKKEFFSQFMDKKRKSLFFEIRNPIPTVIGPKGTLYIIDKHHQARAFYDLGVKTVFCFIEENFSKLNPEAFWNQMKSHHWVYSGYSKKPLPTSIAALEDDPYRSLAGAVRDRGGFRKTDVPFTEFEWACFFRSKIEIGKSKADFEKALEKALKLARTEEAKDLPGFIRSK